MRLPPLQAGTVGRGEDPDLELTFDDVINSLYWDQIKPTEPDILRRFSELHPTAPQVATPEAVWATVRGRQESYLLTTDMCGRPYVELLVPPVWFNGWIDPNDTDYDFPTEVWDGLRHYMVCLFVRRRCEKSSEAAGDVKVYQFRGGRYGLAKKLQENVCALYAVDSPLPTCEDCRLFFESIQFYSLGRLCLLVQCGISRGVLRYEDNLLQPVASCVMPSSAFASKLLPPPPPTLPIRSSRVEIVTREVSSISELGQYIRLLLGEEGVHQLPLSQLKKKMIANFQVVLNPATLGFVKLSEAVKAVAGVRLESEGNNSFLTLLGPDEGNTPSTTWSGCSPRDG